MGKFPVLFFSLKCADALNFEFAVRGIFNELLLLWSEFGFLSTKSSVSSDDLTFMDSMVNFRNDLIIRNDLLASDKITEIAIILRTLCKILRDAYGKPAVVLIDEYDLPLQKAMINGYYPEMLSFIRSLLGETLKTIHLFIKGLSPDACGFRIRAYSLELLIFPFSMLTLRVLPHSLVY